MMVPLFLVLMFLLTLVLELWTGLAFAGGKGKNSIVERERNPRKYWFVMLFQAVAWVALAIMFFTLSA